MTERAYPRLVNLGQNCKFWGNEASLVSGEVRYRVGCFYPKAEMIGRLSCEGIIDDVCIFLLSGRTPKSLTPKQLEILKVSPPSLTTEFSIPPGDIKP